MLDAHQLNIFLVAAETLNFTRAAERLGLSQPSISQHIRALEEHFCERLFIRQGRSLILSDAGRALIPLARDFIKQSTRIDETMSSLKGHIMGRIHLGCDAVLGRYILPACFAHFHELHPEVTISCQTDFCDPPLESLRSGNLHFLFTNECFPSDPCLETLELLQDEIFLITPSDHPWANKKAIAVMDLPDGKFILPAENTDTYSRVNSALSAENLSLIQLDSFLTLSNPEAIIFSVQKGLGVSFSSGTIASTISGVACLPVEDVQITRSLSILRVRNQLSTAARDAFWEFINNSRNDFQTRVLTP